MRKSTLNFKVITAFRIFLAAILHCLIGTAPSSYRSFRKVLYNSFGKRKFQRDADHIQTPHNRSLSTFVGQCCNSRPHRLVVPDHQVNVIWVLLIMSTKKRTKMPKGYLGISSWEFVVIRQHHQNHVWYLSSTVQHTRKKSWSYHPGIRLKSYS